MMPCASKLIFWKVLNRPIVWKVSFHLFLNISFLAIKFAVQLSEKSPLLIVLRLFGSLKASFPGNSVSF